MKIPLVSETTSRTIGLNAEKLIKSDAEWEVFYNNTWRDISDDYRFDTTKEGNVIVKNYPDVLEKSESFQKYIAKGDRRDMIDILDLLLLEADQTLIDKIKEQSK
jgi:hypothetical protein